MVINWIDWMKVLGMFTIIWGHCFPHLFSELLYSFNVPVFFFLSGYLTKPERENKVFWKKLVVGLLIPYLVLSVLKASPNIFSSDGLWSLFAILTGFHTFNDVPGCGKLWFVYTLLIIKIVFHYSNDTKGGRYAMYAVSLIGAASYHFADIELTWAVTNTFLAMPWFLLGQEYKQYNCDKVLTEFLGKMGPLKTACIAIFALLATYIVSFYNGKAYMYRGEFGNNFVLFLLAGLLGILFILLLSKSMDRHSNKCLRLLSVGTIVILAYHQDVNHPLLKFVRQSEWPAFYEDIATFECSVITLLSFVPIIYIISRYLPVLMGNRKINT